MEPPGNTVGDLRETGPMYNNIFHETYYSYTNVKKIGSSGVRVEECIFFEYFWISSVPLCKLKATTTNPNKVIADVHGLMPNVQLSLKSCSDQAATHRNVTRWFGNQTT